MLDGGVGVIRTMPRPIRTTSSGCAGWRPGSVWTGRRPATYPSSCIRSTRAVRRPSRLPPGSRGLVPRRRVHGVRRGAASPTMSTPRSLPPTPIAPRRCGAGRPLRERGLPRSRLRQRRAAVGARGAPGAADRDGARRGEDRPSRADDRRRRGSSRSRAVRGRQADAVVVDLWKHGRGEVALRDPAVIGPCDDVHELGARPGSPRGGRSRTPGGPLRPCGARGSAARSVDVS